MTNNNAANKPFRLEFSNHIIEHLGIKLYQNKPTNVVAEFISNCWDADASEVDVDIKANANSHPSIVIIDNGRGMTRDELTDEFLIIGRPRRATPLDKSNGGRKLMGRKGLGKLAGFGIARTIDVISYPNLQLRKEEKRVSSQFYWLRFSLNDLIEKAGQTGAAAYEPAVLADGVSIEAFENVLATMESEAICAKLLENAKNQQGGVCIHLSDTTLKKAINPDTLLKSMGRRFTVTMLRPDFNVKINGRVITPDDALPPLHPFGYGDWNSPNVEKVPFGGEEREIKYWIKFVSLKDSDWSIEHAGIGIYAHGKIAQDRPFFFDVRGKEILSRYIYGVIEADWLDELPVDVVSTDRRSIDWELDATSEFHEWGASKLSTWLEGFRKWRANEAKKDVVKKIRAVTPENSLSAPEEEALADLLSDVLPSIGNDEEAQNKTTVSFTEAWTHAPTRQLTRDLWNRIFSPGDVDPAIFPRLIDNLRKSLIPEAMGLAVTMAQRIAAITAMRRMIEEERTETDLQVLIESFPWLLGPAWEHLTANETIKTLITKKHKPDPADGGWSITQKQGDRRPDFVFLSDVGGQREFIVFELKGPECGKTLQPSEYKQLSDYLNTIRSVYASHQIKVSGVLVGHDKGGIDKFDNRITVLTWSDVLLEARSLHASYLEALLTASQPNANDIRLKQIADFGGKETIDLLNRMASIGNYSSVISAFFPGKS
jgi:hypothetical protein